MAGILQIRRKTQINQSINQSVSQSVNQSINQKQYIYTDPVSKG